MQMKKRFLVGNRIFSRDGVQGKGGWGKKFFFKARFLQSENPDENILF